MMNELGFFNFSDNVKNVVVDLSSKGTSVFCRSLKQQHKRTVVETVKLKLC